MVLISIVGDFYSSILPIFYEFRNKIKYHFIIYDDFKNDTENAHKIINGTKKFILNNNLSIVTYDLKIDEDEVDSITEVVKSIYSKTVIDKNTYLNLTDGLANVGLIMLDKMQTQGIKVITYDRFDNEYNLLSMHTGEGMILTSKIALKSKMSIKDHLIFKNIDIQMLQDLSLAEKYEDELNEFFERYEADRKHYAKSSKPIKEFLNIATGFLYELYIYNLVKRLNYDDIEVGVKIQDKFMDKLSIENEFDILIMKNNHLHMIECKFMKELDLTQLIYKVDSVRTSLDEDANIMIVTDSDVYDRLESLEPNVMNSSKSRSLIKKVFIKGSPRENIKQFIEDVDKSFKLGTKNIESILENKKSYQSAKEGYRNILKSEMNEFLKKKFKLDVDFFTPRNLDLLLNKTYYGKDSYQTKLLDNEDLKELVKNIFKMLNSTPLEVADGKKIILSVEDIYQYYKDNFI